MGVIILAHGSFYMIGAYMAFALSPLLGQHFITMLLAGVALTVVQAYDRLAAQGLVHSRRGSGVFVSARRAAQAVPRASHGLPTLEQGAAFDTAFLLRSMFREGTEHSGDAGMLPPEWLDQEMLASALRAVGRSTGTSLLTYGVPQGYLPLRQQIASVLQARSE